MAAPTPDAARDQAREILAEDRFSEPSLPTPFKSFFEWLAGQVQPVFDAFGDLIDAIAGDLPGGRALLLGGVAALALVAVVALLSREVRRREAVAGSSARSTRAGMPRTDPRELERLAGAAEERGDLREAVRLRFRAGLVRLDDKGAIRLRASSTTGQVARRLGSGPFERLAMDFDEIVYGGRDADATDVEFARSQWPRVVEGAGHP